MRRNISVMLLLAVLALVPTVNAAYYLAGEFNGWNAGSNVMTEVSPGVWSIEITGLSPGQRQEFKVTDGSWAWNYPSANSWYYADEQGKITVTFNANTVADGWLPAQYRLGLSYDRGLWTIAGEFNSWNNADPATAMTPIGGGIYMFSQTFSAGTYRYKPVVTGVWDSISHDARSVGTADHSFTVTQPSEIVNFFVDALTGAMGVNLNVNRDDRPHEPDPAYNAENVTVAGLNLSWTAPHDPNGIADPNLVAFKVYVGDSSDPNLFYQGTVSAWDENLRASWPFVAQKDETYRWRVDTVMDDATEAEGDVWVFYTESATPQITSEPAYQIVDAGGTAAFSVTVFSPSTPTYQWYKYVDGISDLMLSNGGKISGAATAALTVTGAQLADEGAYYCIVNNDSGIPDQSNKALLGIKRRIAFWPFEANNANSTVAASPVSLLYGDPNFVTTGISGSAMEFDNTAGSEDILYTDPDQTAYFDICNAQMTISCWIKSSFAANWGPIVARHGEDGMGWQLRHRGDSLDRICFTTRGTGSDDGRASNRTVYDGNWHHVAATYDGVVKKIYIDGVVSRVYNGDNGSIAAESEPATGLIASTLSPVSLAGRVRGDAVSGLIFDASSVTPCILDEVEIYNYALDETVIAQYYADTANVAVCPAPAAYDLDGDCIVNLNDFILLASAWLADTSVQPAP